MILTCPKCSTRFVIDPKALGEEGRSVRCGACSHSWLQVPEPAPVQDYEPPLSLEEVVTSPVDQNRRPPRRRRRLWPRLIVWFLFVFVIALILAGGYRYRAQVVQWWPPATKIYSALGVPLPAMPVVDLVVPSDTITYRRAEKDGVRMLIIAGEIENKGKKPRKVGQMRITLLGGKGKELRSWVFTPEAKVLSPGKRMAFKTSISNPPGTEQAVRIEFVPVPGGG